MTARDLLADRDRLVALAAGVEHLGVPCFATADMMERLRAEIRVIDRELLVADANALLRAGRLH